MKINFFETIILVLMAPFILISILIISILFIFIEGRPIFFLSERVGQKNKKFKMIKFRTMATNVPIISTNSFSKIHNKDKLISPFGNFLRKFSLDELPQFFNIIKGEMVLIGPRPALPSQKKLIKLREIKLISLSKPGITGYAQVMGRDNLLIEQKIKFEEFYLKNKCIFMDIKIIFFTFFKIFLRTDVKH